MSLSNTFLNCKIKCIKKATTVYETTPNPEDIIVMSTCYFIPSNFSKNEKTFKYINELIANIESFQMKIDRFTTNPNRWIYRVYIDSSLLELQSIMDTLLSKKKDKTRHTNNNLKNENIVEILKNIKENYNFYLFIYLLLTKYIEQIKLIDKNSKYTQIELFTYENTDIRHKLSNSSYISGNIDTFGTLLRYHPLTDKNIGYCIMRNCSHNLTPLDIIIQNYWIENTTKEFMEYRLKDYMFNIDSTYNRRKIINTHKHIYNQNNIKPNTTYKNTTNINKTKKNTNTKLCFLDFSCNRVLGGLFSVKIKHNHDNYIKKFNSFTKKYIDNKTLLKTYNRKDFNNKEKYKYGIDESIILYIIPKIRNSLNNNSLDNNNLVIILNTKVSSCIGECIGKCVINDDHIKNCDFTDIYLKDMYIDDIEDISHKLIVLQSQYEEIYDILGSLPFNKINTYKLSEMSLFSILKGIDYNIKYIFTFENTKIYNLYNKIKKSTPKNIIDFCKLYIIDISKPETIITIIEQFITELSIAYSEYNFKPILTYPVKINNNLADISDDKSFIETILEPLGNKHRFLF